MKAIPAVLCYNQPELAAAMREQLGYNCAIIDNGSFPALPRLDTAVHFRFEQNYMFTGGWNRAMKALTELGYEWVWMLNSDVQGVSPAMFERLLEMLRDKIWSVRVAALSPSYNSPHAHMRAQLPPSLRKVSWVDWAGPLMSTSWFQVLGGFDERFTGYGCDLDFCKTARQSQPEGQFWVSDELSFHHIGGATAVGEGIGSHVDVALMNRLLHEKWGVNDWTQMI